MRLSNLDRPAIEQYRRFYAEEVSVVAGIAQPRQLAAFSRVPRDLFGRPALAYSWRNARATGRLP